MFGSEIALNRLLRSTSTGKLLEFLRKGQLSQHTRYCTDQPLPHETQDSLAPSCQVKSSHVKSSQVKSNSKWRSPFRLSFKTRFQNNDLGCAMLQINNMYKFPAIR